MKADVRATIYDVAERAQVSAATVSRYLNGTAVVSQETRQRIAQAVEALQYRPNRFAQALKTTRSNLIMMVVPDISNLFYSEMYKVVQAIAGERGYATMLSSTNESVEYEIRALELVKEHRCDGLLFWSVYNTRQMHRRLRELNIPFVSNIATESHMEYEPGIYQTTKHLIAYGHRDIVYVGGSPKTWINACRRNSFVLAMREAGLSERPDRWFEMDFTMEAGYKAGKYVSAMTPMPTAICAANDQLAFGIMMALQECGLRVPQDISITGLDDVEYARLMNPPLTTFCNEPKTGARNAIHTLLRLMDGLEPLPQAKTIAQSTLIIRGSTRNLEQEALAIQA